MNEGEAGVKDGINFSGDSSSCGFSAWVWGIFQKPSHRPLSSLNNLCLLLWIGRRHPYLWYGYTNNPVAGNKHHFSMLEFLRLSPDIHTDKLKNNTMLRTQTRVTCCLHGSHVVVVYTGHMMLLFTWVTWCCLHRSHVVVYMGHMLFTLVTCCLPLAAVLKEVKIPSPTLLHKISDTLPL